MIQKRAELAKFIDHTLLKATANQKEIERLCDEALEWNFCTVCVEPRWIPLVSERLAGSSVLPITVVGFPLGVNRSDVKAYECQRSLEDGAREIDMVVDLGAFKTGLLKEVHADIHQVVRAAGKVPVKVILETCYLDLQETAQLSQICEQAGAAFVKTSTGFGPSGATVEHVKIMRQSVGTHLGVKASGGIRDLNTALKMIAAGANRIGASASVDILKELSV